MFNTVHVLFHRRFICTCVACQCRDSELAPGELQWPLPYGHTPPSPPPPRQTAQSQLERASPPTERRSADRSSQAACHINMYACMSVDSDHRWMGHRSPHFSSLIILLLCTQSPLTVRVKQVRTIISRDSSVRTGIRQYSEHTVKQHFYACVKFMRICQNRPLDKFYLCVLVFYAL